VGPRAGLDAVAERRTSWPFRESKHRHYTESVNHYKNYAERTNKCANLEEEITDMWRLEEVIIQATVIPATGSNPHTVV
jgi:hypothetical protein